MPIYDYKCESCSVTYEVEHGMNDTPALVCPKCGAKKARKVFSTGGILGSTKMGDINSSGPPPSICPPGGGGCPGSGSCGI